MLLRYNFKESRGNSVENLVEQIKSRIPCTAITWDTELKFYESVFENVLAHKELATFRADANNPLHIRLPAAIELPVIITKQDDSNYRHVWGTVKLKKFWGGPLGDFPINASRLNNEPSYDAFIKGALDYYCKRGGLEHLASMYHIGILTQGKILEVQKPTYKL